MNNTQLNEISQDLYDLLLNLHKKLLNPDELKEKISSTSFPCKSYCLS